MLYSIVGQHENALQEAEEAARLDPAWGFYSRVAVYIPLEPRQEAKEVLRDGAKRGYDTEEMHWNLYDLAFLEKDDEGMQRELKWAAGKRQQESRLTCWQSSVDAYYGRMAKARDWHDAPRNRPTAMATRKARRTAWPCFRTRKRISANCSRR